MGILNRLVHPGETHHSTPVEHYLRNQHVPFSIHHHSPAYSAQRLAHIEHVPGRIVAKVVIAFAGDDLIMLCLPAPCRVNLLRLMNALGTDNVRLAREDEFSSAFPDCELGAMPPLGCLYGIRVWVDRTLAECERIIFPAGTHTETVEMDYIDFARLTRPVMADLCSPC
jgi:Ala-tRNA(Pro) deacylase